MPLTPQFPSQGWRQILTARKQIIDAYTTALEQSGIHEVETFHGRAVEGKFRQWLEEFLPQRYGVTSGYVVSPGLHGDQKAPHFDVIVFDRLNSPILWIEDNADSSVQGKSKAIPAEHALCVLEVKSSFSSKTMREAIEHLRDLEPLMWGTDDPSSTYKMYLPKTFVCGCVFIELRPENRKSLAALEGMLDAVGQLQGFFGGIILRGEHAVPASGELSIVNAAEPMPAIMPEDLYRFAVTASRGFPPSHRLFAASISWFEHSFAQFAFDLIARLQGTYHPGKVSSFYGMGSST